jgi:hypothetical protein
MLHPCKFHRCRTWYMVSSFVKVSRKQMSLQDVTIQAVYIEKESMLPTLNCRTGWEMTINLLQHSTLEDVDTRPICTFISPQLVWNKSKELFFAGPTTIFPGLDKKPASHLTPTDQKMSSNSTSSEQDTIPTSNVIVTSQV